MCNALVRVVFCMLLTRLVESSKVLARMGGMVGGSLEVLLGCLPRVDRQRDGSGFSAKSPCVL